jgi:hypothetical protein
MTPSDRYAPERPFPPYAYVPGRHPHPVRDPKGHSFGHSKEPVASPNAADLDQNPAMRYAVDLFNHGYYWEAHEVWEGLWQAVGRQGALADFLKALIHLAAAGVKAREGIANGVKRHAERAKELFNTVGNTPLADIAASLAAQPSTDCTPTIEGKPVLGICLDLELCRKEPRTQ